MNIGVFVDQLFPDSVSQINFQTSLLKELEEFSTHHNIYVFTESSVGNSNLNSKIKFVKVPYHRIYRHHFLRLRKLFCQTLLLIFGENKFTNPIKKYFYFKTRFQELLEELNIRIIWFLTGHFIQVEIPYIITVWDLNHRMLQSFPEYSYTRHKFAPQEKAYREILPRASYIISGTIEGKEELKTFYGIREEKIRNIPLPIPEYVKHFNEPEFELFHHKNSLPEKFLFYPARFWPHKNHIVIILALKILRDRFDITIPVIFTGKDHGNKDYILSMAKEHSLQKQVIFLGNVSQNSIVGLYKKAMALVFPSYAGPDNLPPLEAFYLGCPVITADVPGAKEQLGENSLFFNPNDENQLADLIYHLYQNAVLRNSLIEKGLKKADEISSKNYIDEVVGIFNEFEKMARAWEKNNVEITI